MTFFLVCNFFFDFLCGAPAVFAPICLILKDKSIEIFFVAFTLSRPVKGVDRRFAAEASERRRAGRANRRRGGDLPKVPGRPRSRSARSGSSSTACWAARWRDRPGPKSALPVSPPVRSAKIKAGAASSWSAITTCRVTTASSCVRAMPPSGWPDRPNGTHST